MDMNVTDQDVTNFLTAIIEVGGINKVDNSPDKYIRRPQADNKIATLTIENTSHPLAIYGTKAADALIINPFSEGDADNAKKAWFYASRNVVLGSNIIKLMNYLLRIGAEAHTKADKAPKAEPKAPAKKGKKVVVEETPQVEVDNDVPLLAMKLLEDDVLDIDSKMLKEFESLAKELKDFIVIHYNKTTRQGEVSCLIFNQARRKQFSSIRTKTWTVLENLMRKLLGTDDMTTLAEPATIVGVPVLETFTKIFVKIYKKLEEPLKLVGIELPTLGELESHIKYLAQYYTKARWCVSNPAANPVVPTIPTSGVPGVGIPQARTIPNAVVMPAAPINTYARLPKSQSGVPIGALNAAPVMGYTGGVVVSGTGVPAPVVAQGPVIPTTGVPMGSGVPMPQPAVQQGQATQGHTHNPYARP